MHDLSRYARIASAFRPLAEFVGPLSVNAIAELVERDLGSTLSSDKYRVRPLSPLLHIGSANSPHGVLQSLLRGTIIGAKNLVKLSSLADSTVEDWHANLPDEFRSSIDLTRSLDGLDWLHSAQAVIAYGTDDSLTQIRDSLRIDQAFIPHGHRLSIGVITEASQTAADAAARDIGAYLQQGCLSLIHLYLPAEQIGLFGDQLAAAMAKYETNHPRGAVTLSVDGAISNLRETVAFHAANLPDWRLWRSEADTAWTIVQTPHAHIERSPLFRTVFLKPLPAHLADLNASLLGDDARHLSTVALHPWHPATAEMLASTLPATRFCALGDTQQPTLLWHADGLPALSNLVLHQDIG